jgi:hypothetical protein
MSNDSDLDRTDFAYAASFLSYFSGRVSALLESYEPKDVWNARNEVIGLLGKLPSMVAVMKSVIIDQDPPFLSKDVDNDLLEVEQLFRGRAGGEYSRSKGEDLRSTLSGLAPLLLRCATLAVTVLQQNRLHGRQRVQSLFRNTRYVYDRRVYDAGGEDQPFAGPPDPAISVDVYVDTDDEVAARRVIDAAQALAATLGYEGAINERTHHGSIWRRAKAVLKQGANSSEVRERLTKIERAIELRFLDPRQSQVDTAEAQAFSALLGSLSDIPQACVAMGSILLIKYNTAHGPVVLSRCLSQLELRALEKFPEIQIEPRNALQGLATAVATLEQPTGRNGLAAPPAGG